ncbi:MAG: hypothetical protein E6J70_06920 [Deltaproteobacteria bacterium]|nr:MAG: hypothetical protein E6J70_06920 [Deltaproteobacteria bacterium]
MVITVILPGRVRDNRITDKIPEQYIPAQPYEELFSEGGSRSVRHLGNGSRIWEKMNAEERTVMQRERG